MQHQIINIYLVYFRKQHKIMNFNQIINLIGMINQLHQQNHLMDNLDNQLMKQNQKKLDKKDYQKINVNQI